MKWTPWLFGSLAAALIAGCDGNKERSNDTGTAGGAGTETGTMQGGTDTSTGAATGGISDTAHGGASIHSDTAAKTGGTTGTGTSGASDSARGNQTKSGVTNTETGKSTLGKGVTQTRPDQNQPVTSKGDTVSSSPDSAAGSNQ